MPQQTIPQLGQFGSVAGQPSVSAASYRSTFELFGDGQAVLDDLIKLFGKAPFVPGSPDQTAYNCGAKAVIEHILARIAEADKPAQR